MEDAIMAITPIYEGGIDGVEAVGESTTQAFINDTKALKYDLEAEWALQKTRWIGL